MVKFQIRSEGCRVGRSGRSVADSLCRPHPEQRARASREPLSLLLYSSIRASVASAQINSKLTMGKFTGWIQYAILRQTFRWNFIEGSTVEANYLTNPCHSILCVSVQKTRVFASFFLHFLQQNKNKDFFVFFVNQKSENYIFSHFL